MKYLILNADDLGISPETNEAIRKCFLAGAVTGVSLMAVSDYFREACAMLRDLKTGDAGVHLTLTGGFKPCAKPSRLAGTLLLKDKDIFVRDYLQLYKRYRLRQLNANEIYQEFSCQIRRVKAEGFNVTHLDSHEHIHLFPTIFNITLRLAIEFDIPYVRVPLENSVIIRKRFSVINLLRHMALKRFSLKAKKAISRIDIKTSDAFWGHFHSGKVDEDVLRFIIANLPDGVNEIAMHPALESAELKTLLGVEWRQRASDAGIRILTHQAAANL